MTYFISAVTQVVHNAKRCSVTRRNHAVNLETGATAAELAAAGYKGCKRCGADRELNMTNAAPPELWNVPLDCGCTKQMTAKPQPGTQTRHPGSQAVTPACRRLATVKSSRRAA